MKRWRRIGLDAGHRMSFALRSACMRNHAEHRETEVLDVLAPVDRPIEMVGQRCAAAPSTMPSSTPNTIIRIHPAPMATRERGEIDDFHASYFHRFRDARFLMLGSQLVGDAARVSTCRAIVSSVACASESRRALA